MALKIRGNTQIQDGSIDFAQLQDLSAGVILGRQASDSANYNASAAAPVELSALEIREIAGLDTDDNVEFAAATLNGSLAIKDSNDVSKFSVDRASGNTVVEGTLDSKGAFAVGNDQLTIQSDGTLATNSSMSAASASLGSATDGVYNGGFNAGASNLASATVHGALAHNGSDASTALSSAFVAISGGAINSTPVGAVTASSGAFTTLSGSGIMNIQSGALKVENSNVTMSGSLTIDQNLTVNGTTTTIDTQQLLVEDPLIKLAKNNGAAESTDSLDIGFIGHAGSGNYTGLVRDASDGDKKWYLFDTTEDLSADDVNAVTFTSGAGYSASTLVADLEGNADTASAWASSRTVTFSGGDVSGSFSIDGSADVSSVDLTIGAGVVENSMLAGSISYDKIDFLDTSAALGTDDTVVPSQAAVKSYVDAAVSSGGLTNLEEGDMQMAYNDGSSIIFTKVKELIVIESVSAAEASAAEISLASASEDQFDHLSQVYLNGQKLRMDDDSSFTNGYEYYLDSANSKIIFNDSIIEEGDDLEIRYFIVS